MIRPTRAGWLVVAFLVTLATFALGWCSGALR